MVCLQDTPKSMYVLHICVYNMDSQTKNYCKQFVVEVVKRVLSSLSLKKTYSCINDNIAFFFRAHV